MLDLPPPSVVNDCVVVRLGQGFAEFVLSPEVRKRALEVDGPLLIQIVGDVVSAHLSHQGQSRQEVWSG